MKIRRPAVRSLLALLALVIAASALLVHHGSQWLAPLTNAPQPMLFEVPPGASLGRVAERLESAGLIRSALASKLAARFDGLEGRLQAGQYELSPHLSTREILARIASGRVKTWPVTLPEGSRASEIATRLEAAGLADAAAFLAVANDAAFAHELGIEGASLEGYLYPDTYRLPRGLPPRELVRTLFAQFERVWNSEIAPLLSGSPASARAGLSKHEIVILASIVEKETAAAEERPLIAAVFLNRLERGMRLETDPTVIYGIADFDGNLRRRDLLDETNPYNTYRRQGLPPGPIANPGVEALRAVVEPATSDYLYFVARNDGRHQFSASYREHVNAVNRYQRRRRRR